MKNLPKSIKIFDSTFEITLIPRKQDVSPSEEECLLGKTNFDHRWIRLFDDPNTDDLRKTFLHEILHIIGRELRIHEICGGGSRSEDILDLLSLGFSTLFADNNMAFLLKSPRKEK